MKVKIRILYVLLVALNVGACSLTPEYGCPAPDGVTCMSASEVYVHDKNGQVIRPKLNEKNDINTVDDGNLLPPNGFDGPVAITPGEPIFREPKLMRVWVVDWEDKNNVYHPNHYLYLKIDSGKWVLPVMRNRLLGDGYATQ
jgi:hypothetical protein